MSNVTKFLLLAFGLGLTCLLIIYFKRVADTGFETSNTAVEALDEFNSNLSESDLTMYDGLNVKGSDAVNFIKKHLGGYSATEVAPMYVYVKTSTAETLYKNGGALPDIQDFSSLLYIKPIATFICSIVRDANEVIIGISFQQR